MNSGKKSKKKDEILSKEIQKKQDWLERTEAIKQENEISRRSHDREMLKTFQEQKAMNQALEQLRDAQKKHEHELKILERKGINFERVLYREEKAKQKRLEKDTEKNKIQLQLLKNKQLLDTSKKTNPYFWSVSNMKRNSKRAHSNTFSSAAVKTDDIRKQNDVNGYSDDDILNNLTFKMIHTLREKGLANSPYARQFLRNFGGLTAKQRNLQETMVL